MVVASPLWRRLDVPGHDAAVLERTADGWRVRGMAVFRHGGAAAQLAYRITCAPTWETTSGEVRGWLGARAVEQVVGRTEGGGWTLNGRAVPGLEGCADLDLGFTPATNLQQLRRAALARGEAAEVPVAWLDAESHTLTRLPQRYERRSASTFWYESPTTGYRALLEVDASGFIHRYPELWERDTNSGWTDPLTPP